MDKETETYPVTTLNETFETQGTVLLHTPVCNYLITGKH